MQLSPPISFYFLKWGYQKLLNQTHVSHCISILDSMVRFRKEIKDVRIGKEGKDS